MRKDVAFNDYSREVIAQLAQGGAFLTVKDKDKANIMTIGWGHIGYMWRKPVLMIMVRYSRYTYGLLEKAGEFTVSFPQSNLLKKELLLCGQQSGREVDKFKECKFTPLEGKLLSTPVINECKLHYECKIIYQQAMEPGLLSEDLREKWYQGRDFHVLYYGEIVASYLTDEIS